MAQNRHQSVKRLIFVTILAHIALSLWFVERALLNGDEGWYLYAARQIASGLEPYRDFAFFQMPVYPRALSSLVQPGPGSIIAGRWLSWLTLLMATGIIGLAAMRLRGLGGMLLAVIAVGLNPLVLGTSVLVKPYALCLLLVSGGVFMMTSRDGLRIAAGFCLFGLGAGARLSLLLPLLVLVWAHRRSHVRESLLGSVVGLSLALYPSLSVPWTVLWENWVGAHLGDGAGVVERLQWLGWQLGLCGFFAASFWPGREEALPGLRWAALLGLLVHLVPSSLHIEHAVIVMPLMALAVADRWGDGLTPKTVAVGSMLIGLSFAVGLRWAHLDRETRTVSQTMELSRWVAEHTDPHRPLLTPHLAIAVESNRSVCAGFEMGQFGWAPQMDASRAAALHRLDTAGLGRCLRGPLGGVLIGELDLDAEHRAQVLDTAHRRFSVQRTEAIYGQFAQRLDIFVPQRGLFWTE